MTVRLADVLRGVRSRGSQDRGPRLRNSELNRRRRAVLGVALLAVGLVAILFGVVSNRAAQLEPVVVAPEGSTAVPASHSFQRDWILFADIPDPRRVPSPDELHCHLTGARLPQQPKDMTQFGSRVVRGESLSAVYVVGNPGAKARIRCASAEGSAPISLMPASSAPPFTPTAIALLGVVLVIAAALTHPVTVEIPVRLSERRRRRRQGE